MNKIYKLVWSKTRNMYVAVCEFAKTRNKSHKTGKAACKRCVISALVALNLFFNPFWTGKAFSAISFNDGTISGYSYTKASDIANSHDSHDGYSSGGTPYGIGISIIKDNNGNASAVLTWSRKEYYNSEDTISDSYALSSAELSQLGINLAAYSSTTYTAGNGISISGDTISAKAGTNVTVNSNGISVTGNGTVASGDTGLISGGKLYAEVRPSDNGNYEEYFSTLL